MSHRMLWRTHYPPLSSHHLSSSTLGFCGATWQSWSGIQQLVPFFNDDSQQQEPSFDSLDCCEDPLSSFLEGFIAFDAVNDDDQELDNLLVDLESLDRGMMLSVSSSSSSSSSSCKEVIHCLGDDLLDLDFDWVL